MIRSCSSAAAIAAALILQVAPLQAQPASSGWNQFRGPNGSGVAEDCRPPVVIEAQKAAWKVDVPPGHSSPVLSDRLVVLTAVENDRLVTLAFEKRTGRLAWRREAPEVPLEKVHETSSPAASTPCIDEDRVYVYFGSYGLLCYDLEGRDQWDRPIPTPKSLYGTSSSPIVHGDLLILVIDNDANMPGSKLSQSKIIALNKATGELAWETLRPFHRSGWSTPTIWTHEGGSQLVVLGNGRLRGYDAATGIEKWFVNGFSRETIARPIAAGDRVYASAAMLGGVADEHPDPEPFWAAVMQFDANQDGKLQREEMTEGFTFPLRPDLPVGHPGYGIPLPKDKAWRERWLDGMFARTDQDKDGFWTKEEFLGHLSFNRGKPNLVAVRPGGKGDITESHVTWALHRGIPEVPSPVCCRDRIYLVCDGGILSAVDADTGEIVYRRRLGAGGHYRASPVIADDCLYAVSEQGVVSVVKTGDGFELLHQHALGERVSATPAIDRSTIYIRTGTQLLAFRRGNDTGWEPSFKAGMIDESTGRPIRGTEIIHLAAHKGRLYAGNGYWMATRGYDNVAWAQVLVLDSRDGTWKVDLALGPGHLRVTALQSVTFTTDARGKPLAPPVNLLLAASDIQSGTRESNIWTRDDDRNTWVKTTLKGDSPHRRSTRAFAVHRDRRTGVDRIFVAAGALGIHSGVYDPSQPGRIRWDREAELGPVTIRPMAFAEANGRLYASAGVCVYRRTDGPSPAWEKVYCDDTREHWELGGIRGLTPVPSPDGPGQSVLFSHTDRIIRIDPDDDHRATVELQIRPLLQESWKAAVPGSIIAAYSDMLPLTDPATGRTVHIMGVQGRIERGAADKNYRADTFYGWYAGGSYLIREPDRSYRLKEVNGRWEPGKPKLVAPRTFVVSPFPEDAGRYVYFGGFDANFFPALDTAWIFRASVETVLGKKALKL